MNIDEHKLPTGGQHYSARNKIPNIHEFVAQLDKEKRERDAAIEAEDKQHNKIERHAQKQPSGESKDHVPSKKERKKTKTVRDPVTGKDVEIEDPKDDFEDVVENSQVSNQQLQNRTALPRKKAADRSLHRSLFPTRTWERRPPFQRPRSSLARSIDMRKMSRHHPTQSSPVAPPMCPSTAKRQTSPFSKPPASATSPCSNTSNAAPISCAPVSFSALSLSASFLAVPSMAWYRLVSALHQVSSSGSRISSHRAGTQNGLVNRNAVRQPQSTWFPSLSR